MSPTSGYYYDDPTYENYRQQYGNLTSANYQQQQNERQFGHLSLSKNTKKYFYSF